MAHWCSCNDQGVFTISSVDYCSNRCGAVVHPAKQTQVKAIPGVTNIFKNKTVQNSNFSISF